MRCPTCGRPARIIGSRPFGDGGVQHDRLCTAPASHAHPGAVFQTIEAPAAAVRALGVGRLQAALDKLNRGRARRDLAAQRKAQVLRLLAAGHSTRRTSILAGVNQTRVRAIRDGS